MKKKTNFFEAYSKYLTLGFAIAVMLLITVTLYAQDGNAGINEATNKVKSYFQTGTKLMYAIGAISGLVGAIKVYQK